MSGLYNTISNILKIINNLLWGKAAIITLFVLSAVLTARLGAIQFRHPVRILKASLFASPEGTSARKNASRFGGLSRFQAISTALAASMGTGNIAGVASAIAIGGSGAVFWMVVSSFFVMAFAFTENALGVKYNALSAGNGVSTRVNAAVRGPMAYISKALRSEKAGYIYAAACMLASFGTGSLAQSNSAAASVSCFGLSGRTAAVIFAALTGVIIFRGGRFVAGTAEKLIPFVSAAYITGAAAVIILNVGNLPAVLSEMLSSAFGFSQVTGGISGAAISRAVSTGLRRGIFSNEAGMGSSVFAHASADCADPVSAGMWAVTEVFIDTALCCTLTALAILSSGADTAAEAFCLCFGEKAGYFVSAANVLFAFAAVLGWYFYGEKCAEYLSGGRLLRDIYRLFYAAAVYFGAVWSLELIWDITDIFNALMMFPNIISLMILSKEVTGELSDFR